MPDNRFLRPTRREFVEETIERAVENIRKIKAKHRPPIDSDAVRLAGDPDDVTRAP